MEVIQSFTIDHTHLKPGIYVSRKDKGFTTFDLRFTEPNKEPAIAPAAIHSIEHLMATNEKLDFVRKNEGGTIQYYVPPQAGKLLSDNWMDILLSGSFAGFDTEKNVSLIERIIKWITTSNDVILDAFAGSGTTAHAVLNCNKTD